MNKVIPLIEKIEDLTVNMVDKELYMFGPFIVMDKKNKNGRIYSSERTIPIVEDHIKNKVKTNRSVGELDHPTDIEEIPKIHMENITHRIVDLTLNGNVYVGKALIASDTPKGQIVKGLFSAGIVLGASSRATGKVDDLTKMVLPGMNLITPADIVWNPSAEEAILDGIYESENFVKPLFGESEIELLKNMLKRHTNKVLVNNIVSKRIRQ